MTIDDLMQQIEETERLIAVYRNANEVIVGTQDEIYSRRGLINRTTLTAAEIGDQIVSILELRLAAMRAELQKLGLEGTPRLRATGFFAATVGCALRVPDAVRAGAGQLAAPPPAAIRRERPRRPPA